MQSRTKQVSFQFVLDEISSLRPEIKKVFGFTYVYLADKLLCALRENEKKPATNGMWLFTSAEHVESLAREFPDLSRRQIWRSGEKCWIVLASRLPAFEEYAYKACELMLRTDGRIGRLSRVPAPRKKARVFEAYPWNRNPS